MSAAALRYEPRLYGNADLRQQIGESSKRFNLT